ncbi:MAG: GntR family transcriptional regulator [Acidobacteriota bacterium]
MVKIEFASPVPIYEQIKRCVKQALAQEALRSGDELPSIRELAAFLKINPNTVVRAYRELTQDGVIDGRAGKGFWVKADRPAEEEKLKLVRDEFLRLMEKAVAMGVSAEAIREMVNEFFSEET